MTKAAHDNNTLARMALITGMVALLALMLSWTTPAAAFIEEDPGEEATTQQDATQQDATQQDPAGSGTGFVEVESAPSAPTGGVDAGFGGTASASSGGFGLPYAVAAALLGLTAVAHVVRVRRVATADL